MTKKRKIIACIIISVILVFSALFLGLFIAFNNRSFNEKINGLLKNTQFANESFIGFAIADKNDSIFVTDYDGPNVFDSEFLDSDTDFKVDFMVINEKFKAEDVLFKNKFSSKKISNSEIHKYGVITNYFVMNDFLYLQITENWQFNENVKLYGAQKINYCEGLGGGSHFILNDYNTIIAVDLVSKQIFSFYDICLKAGILTDGNRYSVNLSLESGMLETNASIGNSLYEDFRQETYFIEYNNDDIELKLVGKQLYGFIQDIHNNIYIVENPETPVPAENVYDFRYVNFFERDNEKRYIYFCSSDRQIYRALKSSYYSTSTKEHYAYVESLQADKRWSVETSSSDEMLQTFSIYAPHYTEKNGKYILREGKIITIARDYYEPASPQCYSINGHLVADVRNKKEEAILNLGNISQITSDFEYIDFSDGYDGYDKIASFLITDEWVSYRKYDVIVNSYGFYIRECENARQSDYTETYFLCKENAEIQPLIFEPLNNFDSFKILSVSLT